MTRSIRTAAAAVLAIFLPISASALDVTVDDSFGGYGFNWDRTGEMLIRYRPVLVDGEMYICGAYSNRGGANITRLGRQVMREASITMNGADVVRNLQFFNVVSSANNRTELVGTTASCMNTGLRPSNMDLSTVSIGIRSGRYRVRR
jgi:hypothetical protein